MKYYKLFIEFFLVSLIVSEILESAKLPASAKLPFLPLLRNNKRGGGVSIFINNNIKYKLNDNLSLSVNDAYDMVTISFIYEYINYVLLGIYKAPIGESLRLPTPK